MKIFSLLGIVLFSAAAAKDGAPLPTFEKKTLEPPPLSLIEGARQSPVLAAFVAKKEAIIRVHDPVVIDESGNGLNLRQRKKEPNQSSQMSPGRG